jgi:hypothetical protein
MSHSKESKNTAVSFTSPKRIAKIQFGTLQSHEIEKVSEMQVTSRDVYQIHPIRAPATQVYSLMTNMMIIG